VRRGLNLENMNRILPRPCNIPRPDAAVALVATLDEPEAVKDRVLRNLPDEVSWVQVRADRIGGIDPRRLRQDFHGKLLYSLGSALGRGTSNGLVLDRSRRLIAAAADDYDLIELDGERDIGADVLEAIPPARRLICWRGAAVSAAELNSQFRRLSRISARSYLLVTDARHAVDGLAPLTFLRTTGRSDVTAYADGQAGVWSRLLAARLGAPFVFVGSVGECREPSDGPNPARMIEDFGLPDLPYVDRICGIVGASATKSLSPRLHNAAYRALAYPGLFVPFRVESFTEFWRDFIQSHALDQIGMSIQGLTVASPNKEIAADLATIRSRAAVRSASSNLLFRRGPAWVATTTDPIGVLANVPRRSIAGRRAAVVGCGGSGRAIARALSQLGASVTLVNRCRERGEQASRLLGLPFTSLSAFSVAGFELIINATPVGSQGEALPFAIDQLDRDTILVDLVYAQRTTALVAGARARGVSVVEGREVLLRQVERQFVRMTGLAPPAGLLAEKLGLAATSRAR
jgi:3-dehydroquinate dehydratase / shikimate dehydrogenase